MKFPVFLQHKGKSYIHGLQGLIIFLAWALTIAVFTKDGKTDGRTKYYFVLCWLCIPALIYQSAVPSFEKTKKFANAYVFAVVDLLLTILWFAAFIAVAAWTNGGIKPDKGKSGCAAFVHGSESKCKLSKATIYVGVLIFLLFIVTSVISVYNLIEFRKTGVIPGPTRPSEPVEDDQTKYAFSSNPHDDLDEDIEDQPPPVRPHGRDDDQYALLHTDTEDGTHPGRPLSWGRDRDHGPSPPTGGQTFDEADTSYHGGATYNAGSRIAPEGNPFADQLPPPRRNVYDTDNATESSSHGGQSAQAGDPFRDDLALSHAQAGYTRGGERVEFPDAEYHR